MASDRPRHGAASAGLCEKCAKMRFIANIGSCTICGGFTASGSYRLCRQCSDKRNECMACGAPLDPKKD